MIRCAVVHVESQSDNSQLYAPTDYNVLMDDIEKRMSTACEMPKKALSEVKSTTQLVEVLWLIKTETDLITRGKTLADDAKETLHLAIWANEFTILMTHLLKAIKRGMQISPILYSEHDGITQLQKLGAGAVLHSRTKLEAIPIMGKQFVLVADRQKCIVGSIFPDSVEPGCAR